MSTQPERRFTPSTVDVRASRFLGKQHQIGGYAAKFNVRSENLGGAFEFYEVLEEGFFDNVLKNDVVALFNHNNDLILGRTSAGTCRISQDRTGLAYEVDLDEGQSYARDLLISIERGDVHSSSFAFSVDPSRRRFVENGNAVTCYLQRGGCTRLWDTSVVVLPAYPDATVALRAAEEALGRRLLPVSVARAARERELQLAEVEQGFQSPNASAAAARARQLQLAQIEESP